MQNNAVETIKQKLSIEMIVGSYVKLERAGKNFRACCPFHHEKTPSFTVTPDRGMYYCYGCHKGGDIFSFVEEIEGISFREALVSLAEKAGVSLQDDNTHERSRLAMLREIMEVATKYYEVGLRTTPAAVNYLIGRQMTKETMINFRIGYAPQGWSGLALALQKKNYREADILATGLCIKGDRGLYDRFRERIMFPIMDAQGRVIAFTGRVLPGYQGAERPVGKYINSPETDLYHKSQVLFGFDKAKRAIQEQGHVIIVEGQMDCIMSHQTGVTNTVALSGTASTEYHLKQLSYFTQSLALCLDADKAGITAAQKTAQLAYQEGMKVFAISLPQGKDPAELISHDPEAWKNAITHKESIITFLLRAMTPQDKEHKSRYAEEILFPLLAFHNAPITLDEFFQEISFAFGLSGVEPIRESFQKFLARFHAVHALETQSSQKISTSQEASRTSPPVEQKGIRYTMITSLLGIILTIRDTVKHTPDESLEKTLHDYEEKLATTIGHDIAGEIDQLSTSEKSTLLFETEKNLGPFPGTTHAYDRAFHNTLSRLSLDYLDESRNRIQEQLMHDPENVELLRQLHILQVQRDALVRAFSH
jgi:DNA primase